MNKEGILDFYTYLSSQQTVQKYLFQCYKKSNEENAETLSYQNSLSFLYYLEHGKKFYRKGQTTPLEIKPILLFYGMSHFIKALLMTIRPYYPESTKLLAHGVSTRKRKKRNYTFSEDQVKRRQFGLFPYFAKHICGVNHFPVETFKMGDLLAIIPEMDEIFTFNKKTTLCKVGNINDDTLSFPNSLLDTYHLTAKSFVNRITPFLPGIKRKNITAHAITIQLNDPIDQVEPPFYTHMNNDHIYFPASRNYFLPFSELMIHYLLLYNLSMLSRYEIEWWGDLINSKADQDYAFISHFLHITGQKIPLLVGKKLIQRH